MAEHQEEAFAGCQDKKKLKHLQGCSLCASFYKAGGLRPISFINIPATGWDESF
jgi:hypothetical protein